MDFLTCITEGMTWTRLTLIVAGFAALFIPFDIWMNRKSEIIEQRNGGGFIDHGDLWKALKAMEKKRDSDHRE